MNPARRCLAAFCASALLLASGCASTLSVVSVPTTAVNWATMVYQSIENAQILIRVHEDLTKESAREITGVAVFMGKESLVEPCGRIGDIEAVVGDNLAMRLMLKGFRVYDADDIQKVEEKPVVNGNYYTGQMLRTCETLGARAMISGHVVAGRTRFGILGTGRSGTVVHSVSLSLTEVRTAMTLMTIDIQYRVGQKPHVVAEGLAMIIRAKLDDPGADIDALFRKNNGGPDADPDRHEGPLSLNDSLP